MADKKCLKCGRDCSEDQAFCGGCLEEMARYPVKPGVVVLLPQRESGRPSPRRRHSSPPPEEQLAKLKRRIAVLRAALLVLIAAMGVWVWLTASGYFQDEAPKPLPGQNYSSETTGPGESK